MHLVVPRGAQYPIYVAGTFAFVFFRNAKHSEMIYAYHALLYTQYVSQFPPIITRIITAVRALFRSTKAKSFVAKLQLKNLTSVLVENTSDAIAPIYFCTQHER